MLSVTDGCQRSSGDSVRMEPRRPRSLYRFAHSSKIHKLGPPNQTRPSRAQRASAFQMGKAAGAGAGPERHSQRRYKAAPVRGWRDWGHLARRSSDLAHAKLAGITSSPSHGSIVQWLSNT